MRVLITILLLMTTGIVWSQDVEERIKGVENGLTFPATATNGQDIVRSNLIQRLEENKIYGASVAIVHDGEMEWSKAYGVAEAGTSIPVTTETLFQCASIGKVITALAALTLVEGGKIDLDEDVNNKLQRWKIAENVHTQVQKVTLRHLLSHSAGLTDDYGFLGYDPKDEIPSLIQILNNEPIANTKKPFEIGTTPGKVERYSGGGFLIVQLLIEDVSGESFADYVREQIFEPLEMNYSSYSYRPDKDSDRIIAAGHLSKGKALKNKKYHIYPEKAAAGPWTTAEDLAKFIIGIQGAYQGKSNAILSQKLTKELLTVQINNKGLGVNIKGVEKSEAFWHAGQNLGYTALLYGLVDKGDGAVILLNSDGGERLMQEFIGSVAYEYNWPVMQSYSSMEIPKEMVDKLTGRYVSPDKSKSLSIFEKKGILMLKTSEAKSGYQLYRIEENRYTFKDSQDYFGLSFNLESNPATMIYKESIGKIVELKKEE